MPRWNCRVAGPSSDRGRLRYVRGPQGKFLLQGKLPEVGEVAMGQGRFPWLLAGGKTVLAGTKNPAARTAIRCDSSIRKT